MSEENEEKSSASLINGAADLEGKPIIDSRGIQIGVCKTAIIDSDGQIGLAFETKINDKTVVPSQTIPYSTISKISDVIELRDPINIKIAQSVQELKRKDEQEKEGIKEERKKLEEKPEEKDEGAEKEEEESGELTISITPSRDMAKIPTEKREEEKEKEVSKQPEVEEKGGIETEEKLEVEAEQDLKIPRISQADASQQLSKALHKAKNKQVREIEEEDADEKIVLKGITYELREGLEKLEQLFQLVSNGDIETKCEAIKVLTSLTTISPVLGRSLIPRLMGLKDYSHQEVRLTVGEQLEIISESSPGLFEGYFLELLENAFEEPTEEVREKLIKTLHNIAIKTPKIAAPGLEEFLKDAVIGRILPEIPSKTIHETTLRIVSGSFQLTRIAIRSRLPYLENKGSLGERCAEELQDYNATLIGLTIIESYSLQEAEKLIKLDNFRRLGETFADVIETMIEAYKRGSFELLQEVVDKKIEIPISVIERFYEVKISETLRGVESAPLEFFTKDSIVGEELAEEIIYSLVIEKRVDAAINVNNNRTFIANLPKGEEEKKKEEEEEEKEEPTKKEPVEKKKKETKSTSKTKKIKTKNGEIKIPYKGRVYTFEKNISLKALKSKRGVPLKVKEQVAEARGFESYPKKKK
ncbi:MAG: hypothetical protein GF308_12220 [Candidatus Heimdallarchaeota archaeon]|nr:hypothetical protein [Candidatus Heimdallarchaeota archaeon]